MVNGRMRLNEEACFFTLCRALRNHGDCEISKAIGGLFIVFLSE